MQNQKRHSPGPRHLGTPGVYSRRVCPGFSSLLLVLFLHDSRDCPETAVSLLHQKRLGSGSEPTNKQDKLSIGSPHLRHVPVGVLGGRSLYGLSCFGV